MKRSLQLLKIGTLKTGADRRSGVTLAEVLISLMIMSIGLTLVASLFPIAALRTLQATQLTNAVILKHNTEALISMLPELVFDPDRDGNLIEHFQNPHTRNYVVDPVGFYTHYADGNAAAALAYGYFSVIDANGNKVNVPVTRFGGGLHIRGKQLPGLPPLPARTVGISLTTTDPGERRALRELAAKLAQLGDGWTTQYEGTAVALVTAGGGGVTGVTLPAGTNLSDIPYSNHSAFGVPKVGQNLLIADAETSRIVVFSVDERISQSFPLTHINGTTVYWSEDIDADGSRDVDFNYDGTFNLRPLPNEFFDAGGNANIGRVLLQTKRANDYSWMLNVRRRSDGMVRSIDVVIRYSRGGNPGDEQVYPVTIAGGTPFVGVLGVNMPNIRKGDYMFDPANAVWHRIRDVQERPKDGWPNGMNMNALYGLRVTLEGDVRATEGAGSDLLDGIPFNDPDPDSVPGSAMFPSGIVDVFPLGSREMPENMRQLLF